MVKICNENWLESHWPVILSSPPLPSSSPHISSPPHLPFPSLSSRSSITAHWASVHSHVGDSFSTQLIGQSGFNFITQTWPTLTPPVMDGHQWSTNASIDAKQRLSDWLPALSKKTESSHYPGGTSEPFKCACQHLFQCAAKADISLGAVCANEWQ